MTTDGLTPHTALLRALDPKVWSRANRELLAKIVTELTFEEVLQPEPLDPPAFALRLTDDARLTYTATRRHLGHWRVDPDSLRWEVGGQERELPDVVEIVARAVPALGVDAPTTAGVIAELANTLVSDAFQLAEGRPAAELAAADPVEIESAMRGHPWIAANKGRLGFDADDLASLTPESGRPLRVRWVAAAPGRADVRQVDGLDHQTVVRQQLGDDVWGQLRHRVARAGLDPDEVAYLPVHPWQWRERIVPLHAGDLARGELVPLGEAPARYRPQQSLRTLVDADHPERRYLKLPLSVLNTSVYRGLPRERTLAAPALTQWLLGLLGDDPFLAETGLTLLGEVASVSVAHRAFGAVPGVPYQHTEMLGAIWRESVAGHVRAEEGEKAVTLAALLHRDPHGTPLLAPLVAESGLGIRQWVDRLHAVTLPPLAHVLYRYGVTFSPHAQNCLLVLRHGVPERLVVKDFVDDAMVAADPLPELAEIPDEVRRVLGDGLEAPVIVQWIQGGLLVCVHRYLSELVEEHFGLPETEFWASARQALHGYQDRFAHELADRFALFDLTAPSFPKLCLNRVRLFDRGYRDDPERPVAAVVGQIDNPLAREDPGSSEAPSGSTGTSTAGTTRVPGRDRAVYEERSRTRGRVIWTRPVDAEADLDLLHRWMHEPEVARYWEMAWPMEKIAEYLHQHDQDPHRDNYVTYVDDTPVGYLETYDPAHDILGTRYEVRPGDLGAHVLIGDPDFRGRYSVSLGLATNRFLFGRPGVERVVGEPDAGNHNFLSLLAFLGFRKLGEIDLPGKRAALMVCTREDFERLSTRRRRSSS
ncbi:MAG TPA: GNAT family N-acetyltransferase [Acidimicrobiales bacterium]